jgi:membrane-associated protease RseP (regulator of RpoE activity)
MFVEIAVVAAAYVAGTVSPAVGRKIKAFVDKEIAAAKADVFKAEADVKADVKKL